MPRRYYRRARYSRPKKKYSWEHANFSNTNGAVAANNSWTGKAVLVSEAGIGGMRKAKNFTLSINVEWDQIMFFALVYVPEGTRPSELNIGGVENNDDPNFPYLTTASIYEPNQNVILTGIVPANQSNRITYSTRMARNLNSGDSIFLVFRTLNQAAALPENSLRISATLDYCITY